MVLSILTQSGAINFYLYVVIHLKHFFNILIFIEKSKSKKFLTQAMESNAFKKKKNLAN